MLQVPTDFDEDATIVLTVMGAAAAAGGLLAPARHIRRLQVPARTVTYTVQLPPAPIAAAYTMLTAHSCCMFDLSPPPLCCAVLPPALSHP